MQLGTITRTNLIGETRKKRIHVIHFLGSKYAMLSVKTQMVHVLKRYKLTSDIQISDVIHIVDIITRSQNGYPVKIWNRKSDHQND